MDRWTALACIASLLVTGCMAPATQPLLAGTAETASDAAAIGNALGVSYRVLANRAEGGCRVSGRTEATEGACYEAEITLTSEVPLDLSNATIFFSQVEPVSDVDETSGAEIAHMNGDLHRLHFRSGSTSVGPTEPRRLAFTVRGLALTRAKFMPNFYVVDANGDAALIQSTKEQPIDAMGRKRLPFLAALPPDLRRGERDLTRIETPEVTYELNRRIRFAADAVDTGIVPSPTRVEVSQDDPWVDIARGLDVSVSGAERARLESAFSRLKSLGVRISTGGLPTRIVVDQDLAIPPEGYELSARADGIFVRASGDAGAFYGIQSLAALVRVGAGRIPALEIEDAPRFAFRGLHLDIARNFHGLDTIRALIDQMAAYKLNKLHLHLADDEGWRLEIAGLPELTDIGSRRCHDPLEDSCLLPQLGSGPDASTSGSGFISETEYIALLQYAAARHIEIIPALDMPGHARAAVKSMEARYRRLRAEGASEEEASRFLLSDLNDRTQYRSIQHYSDNTINVCRESSYRFVGHVLDRLVTLHRRAGTPLQRYHIGADETAGAWTDSPLCQAYVASGEGPADVTDLGGHFVARVARIVSQRGVTPAAWSDGLTEAEGTQMPPRVQSNVWDTLAWGANGTANRHANRGWDVVISIPDATYFDLPYAAHPDEGGYYWAIRRAPTRKLFSMMPENLPAHAAYWKDRDEQAITIDDRATFGERPHRPLDPGRRFIGLQGHVWSETIRDRETLGYQLFPRMLALAERAWSRADWEIPYDRRGRFVEHGDAIFGNGRREAMERDWSRFASIVAAKEIQKLELGGWSYRLPPVGARVVDGQMLTNTSLPNLTIECRVGRDWKPVELCEAPYSKPIKLRSTNQAGTRYSREVKIEPVQ